MRAQNYEAWVKVYEDFYQKPLVYRSDERSDEPSFEPSFEV
jgi:hypothetical protein